MSNRAERETTLSRRLALQRGAMAVGLVWATPVVRSIRPGNDAGTPPPTSTTTTTILVGPGEVIGPFSAVGPPFEPGPSFPECVTRHHLDFTSDATTLGHWTASVDFCGRVDTSTLQSEMIADPFTIDAEGGTLSVSSFRGFLGTSDEHFLMVIGSGIGAFAGVTGELFFDGEFIFGAQGGDTFEGSMSGTLVFPP